MSEGQRPSGFKALLAERDPAFLFVVGLALLGLVLICVFGSMLTWDNFFGEDGPEVADGTPQATLDAEPGVLSQQASLIEFSGPSTPISVTLDAPNFLQVGESQLPVVTQVLQEDGAWEPLAESRTAVWVYGTIINYVFGMPAEMEATLNGLVPGDPIQLTTKGGKSYTFSFTGREITAMSNNQLFAQNRPGITLVLLGSAESEVNRLVVRGEYIPDIAFEVTESSPQIELGQTAQIDSLQLTAVSTTFAADRPEAAPGTAFYYVDFTLTNVGASAFDTGLLRLTLVDDLGNQYALNPVASQLGNSPALSGSIQPDATLQASAGYQIPLTLNSESLRLVVSRVDRASQVEVEIPFGGSSAANAAVTLSQVAISGDGASVTISGQVTNSGEQPVIIGEPDISLSSAGTVYLILSTNPSFPWSVPAGQTVPFTLSFQRPLTPEAVITIAGQSFELSGMR